uniref:Uncharacterized protein n=1 Tax=Cyprinodon variegatus TaxID=28743 RepID=A0A3Q2E5I9_CYPVA
MMYYPGFSFHLRLRQRRAEPARGPNTQTRGAVKPLPLLSLSNGKGSTAF